MISIAVWIQDLNRHSLIIYPRWLELSDLLCMTSENKSEWRLGIRSAIDYIYGHTAKNVADPIQLSCWRNCKNCHKSPKELTKDPCYKHVWVPTRHLVSATKDNDLDRMKAVRLFLRELGEL